MIAEPALTNIGMIQPAPGFHDALRGLVSQRGALLVLDETHTMVAGPGGLTAQMRPRARPARRRQVDRRAACR